MVPDPEGCVQWCPHHFHEARPGSPGWHFAISGMPQVPWGSCVTEWAQAVGPTWNAVQLVRLSLVRWEELWSGNWETWTLGSCFNHHLSALWPWVFGFSFWKEKKRV